MCSDHFNFLSMDIHIHTQICFDVCTCMHTLMFMCVRVSRAVATIMWACVHNFSWALIEISLLSNII